MKRSLRIFAALLVTAVSWNCRGAGQAPRTARNLSDSCTAALAAGDQRDEGDRAIAALQTRARGGSHRRQALEQLGYRYVARARVRNDEGDYTLAERTAECLTSTHPDDASAMLLRGHVLHQPHRFHEAEQIARQLVAKREFVLDDGDAWARRGRRDRALASRAPDAFRRVQPSELGELARVRQRVVKPTHTPVGLSIR